MKDFFKDLIVIELAGVLAGPMAGMFFAELGAKVIKIENPNTKGDVTRSWRLKENDDKEISAYYSSINYNKEVLFVDLKKDKETFDRLLLTADIVITNFNDQVSIKLGVDYAHCKAIKEDIIYGQLYAYNKEDPRPGYDLVMQAESGFMMMNGYPDGLPAKMPVALIDIMAAHQIKESLLLALIHKGRTGQGTKTETSLFQSAIASLANQASNYLMTGYSPSRLGTLHPNIAPYGDLFKTKDEEYLILAVGSDKQFEKLGKTLKFTNTKSDTFGSNAARVKNRNLLREFLSPLILKFTYSELSILLKENTIPHCKPVSLEEVFKHPLSKSMILEEISSSGQKTKRVSTLSFNFLN